MSTPNKQSAAAITVRAAEWHDPVAVSLRNAMETEMEIRYADRLADFLSKRQELPEALGVDAEAVAYVGVAHAGLPDTGEDLPVGHVALRWTGGDLELKRMYVAPSHRGKGVSTALLDASEWAASALGVRRIILQTGDRQPDAVRLYEREGYTRIPIFPPYEWMTFSICMEKVIDLA
ncbi:MAG: hypothetical protein JWN52_8148 [Actinomycetia bacterium]|nr:hypothetical protein [Actinomycetes bacterium]